MRQVEEILGSRTLTPAERISMRSYIFPAGTIAYFSVSLIHLSHFNDFLLPCMGFFDSMDIGSNYVYETVVPNKADVNNGITYYCQIGDNVDVRLRETLRLLSQIAREPAFDQLRTKEQLGYIVSSGYWVFTGTMGFRITIQSERNPVYLESRVDAFLEHLKVIIEDMSQEDFERERQSLIDKIMDQLKNLREETRRLWDHIDDGYYEFRHREYLFCSYPMSSVI
jgi:secreted Zn-dependent insulinase-like peptidase